MSYSFSNAVRQNDTLRSSFNDLTRSTFGFDFSDWYTAGHWGDLYIPHVLLDGEKVISNVSVNHMRFDLNGVQKHYIQLGTVMTDAAYRNQGLNRQLMERVLSEYAGKVDGIYLFGNDSVLDYYPKYGFQPVTETEYYLPRQSFAHAVPYALEPAAPEQFYAAVLENPSNPNDGLYMYENLGLYQFWCAAEFGKNIYYLPETDTYVVASLEDQILRVHQIIGPRAVDLRRLANSFGPGVTEAVLGYTPADRTSLAVRPHKAEDTTLFILGDDLNRIAREQLLFPTLSYA